MKISYNEFHISRSVREECGFEDELFASTGNAIFADFNAVFRFQEKLNGLFEKRGEEDKKVSAGNLNAAGLIDEVFHRVCMLYRRDGEPDAFEALLSSLDSTFGRERIDALLFSFTEEFPPVAVYKGEQTAREYLAQTALDEGTKRVRSNREQVLEELILLHLANENPAMHQFEILFSDSRLAENEDYIRTWNSVKEFFLAHSPFGPKNNSLINMLKEPVVASPTSLKGQLDYIRQNWTSFVGDGILRLLEGIDTISEEEKAAWHPIGGAGPETVVYDYDDNLMKEYERFSPDLDWMPRVVLMAKTVLVWLYQLSKKYGREITRLDQIPDEELDALRDEGFTGLWLIGLWERSAASRRIKQINGNPEAAASAYSLYDYEIAGNLGGWSALENLRDRCRARGIRLASDMVPNHTGMDGRWVIEHPDYFISTRECPFPQYTFNGENLSRDGRVSLYLEDHYYSKTDCAVCFKRVDNATGDVMYIYHGNDGTGMPWNDTAQIDFLNPTAREAVIQQILRVARSFPIIRFDAAMVLAKRHIRRLWYPEPGHGGDIATRSRYAMSSAEFERRIPNEFWREVVDRVESEVPDTLLLAEAFWMMEGYFTRTLGMHRVYNSAFMNMLKKEENQKYRDTVKNTIKFDPEVLKRFVNFMNNPDEETAVAQFGKGDKYFGICTLMVTMPGLPMFGHGQLEGFEEKYGMEYTRAYRDEQVDEALMARHRRDIFPLMHKRYLFAGVENFLFYDVWNNGVVNENVFAYSNSVGNERTIVFYNNKYERASGWIHTSCEYAVKTPAAAASPADGSSEGKTMATRTFGKAMGLSYGYNHYVIFHEMRSGLWYVRKSDDIINHGMFVSLNGFECQMYLDIQEVVDDEEGKYYRLNEMLNGAGAPDLDAAWEEFYYKDLFTAFKSFVTEDLVLGIRDIFEGNAYVKTGSAKRSRNKTRALSRLLKGARDAGIAFYEEAESASDAESPRGAAPASGGAVEPVGGKSPKASHSAKYFNAFARAVRYVYKAYLSGTEDESEEIGSALRKDKTRCVILCTAAAVAPLGGEWSLKRGLVRKLCEVLSPALPSLAPDAVRSAVLRCIEGLRIGALRKCRVRGGMTGAALTSAARNTAKMLVKGSSYAGVLSGVNEFAGVEWFNKEMMEDTLWYFLAAETMVSGPRKRQALYALYQLLLFAEEHSGYKCADFVKYFPSEAETPRRARRRSVKKLRP